MTDLIIVDDTLPIQNCHFLIKQDGAQIKASPLGVPYLTEAMTLGFAGIVIIKELVKMAAEHGVAWTKCHALVEFANRRMYGDADRFFWWLAGIAGAAGGLDE